jgi:hypothetical protein
VGTVENEANPVGKRQKPSNRKWAVGCGLHIKTRIAKL